jgi:hypothetical protein
MIGKSAVIVMVLVKVVKVSVIIATQKVGSV